MLAVCKVAPGEGNIEVCEREPTDPGPGEIRIKVAAAGICGTDMQIYYWAPRMRRRMVLPRTLGHEASGVVDAVGPDVRNCKLGDHVSLESHIFCGTCRPCRRGDAHLCEHTTYPGISIDGAFAEYVTVPSQIAWVNPPELSFEIAAMMEPFGIAVHTTLAGGGVAGRTVLVNGCGPIGLMNVATARALGAVRIIASDLNPLRLDMALKMGADRAVNVADEDLGAIVADMTGGSGVDVAIEYSGSEAGFNATFDALAKGGDFRLVGAPPGPIEVDFTRWLQKCPAMQNIHGRRIWGSWQHAADLLAAGAVDLAPIMSHTLKLADGPRGFELIREGKAVKPLLIP